MTANTITQKIDLAERILAARCLLVTLLDHQGNQLCQPVGRSGLSDLHDVLREHPDGLVAIATTARTSILSMPTDYADYFLRQWQLQGTYRIESGCTTIIVVKNPKTKVGTQNKYLKASSNRYITVLASVVAPGQDGVEHTHTAGDLAKLVSLRKHIYLYRKPKTVAKLRATLKDSPGGCDADISVAGNLRATPREPVSRRVSRAQNRPVKHLLEVA